MKNVKTDGKHSQGHSQNFNLRVINIYIYKKVKRKDGQHSQ